MLLYVLHVEQMGLQSLIHLLLYVLQVDQMGLQSLIRLLYVLQVEQMGLQSLINAYRVGMLAMETLARRVQDDRPQHKYAPHPPYGEEIKWLLGVAKKLGQC